MTAAIADEEGDTVHVQSQTFVSNSSPTSTNNEWTSVGTVAVVGGVAVMILGLAVIVLLAQKQRHANVTTAVVCAPYTAPVGAINAIVIDVAEAEVAV